MGEENSKPKSTDFCYNQADIGHNDGLSFADSGNELGMNVEFVWNFIKIIL